MKSSIVPAAVVLWLVAALLPGMLLLSNGVQAQSRIFVELARPQSNANGQYVQVPQPGPFVVVGFAAAPETIGAVTVDGVRAALFHVQYHVLHAPSGLPAVGFRASIYLRPADTIQVQVLVPGQTQTFYFLPSPAAAFQRSLVAEQPVTDAYMPLRMANAYSVWENYAQAIPLYRQFIRNNPRLAVGRYLQALALEDQGQYPQAAALLRQVLQENPTFLLPRLDLATVLQRDGDLNNAIAQYRQVIDEQPGNAEAHWRLGDILTTQQQYQAAINQQTQAIRRNPRQSFAYVGLGEAYLAQGHYNLAMNAFRRAVAADPTNGLAYLGLAHVYYQRAQWSQAWLMVHRAEQWNATPNANFIAALSRQMPEPVANVPLITR